MKKITTTSLFVFAFLFAIMMYANNPFSVESMTELCVKGDQVACMDIEMLTEGIVTEKDRLEYLKASCEVGVKESCEMMELEIKRPLHERYKNFLSTFCDEGDKDACTILNGEKESPYKRYSYKKFDFIFCNNGDDASCQRLEITKTPKDSGRSMDFFAESCDKGNAESCNMLGEMYKDGTSIRADKEKAAEYFENGCTLGNSNACSNLISVLSENGGRLHNRTKIEQFENIANLLNKLITSHN